MIEDWKERKNARRDEAVTNCPARAWEWHGPRYRKSYHPARPIKVNVYFHPTKRTYYRRHGHKKGRNSVLGHTKCGAMPESRLLHNDVVACFLP